MHHASLLIGGHAQALAHVESLFGTLKGSPDYFPWEGETFGIGEARRLSEQAARKAFGPRKVFFIAPETITLEAQNALLKTFEEPGEETYFFLVLRDAATVIPTLRSRMQTTVLQGGETGGEAEKFLKLSVSGRLAFVKKFVDREESLPAFLDALLLALRKRTNQSEALKSAFKMRLVADQRAASARLVLEHLALLL
ncbi:hypothetical protein KW784_01890 [Candidatus Parcubacteria bacterium]|nr:hypothetical protein [Candidatus Parcubacteria bacterium]